MNCSYVQPKDLQHAWANIKPSVSRIALRYETDWIPEDVYASLRSGESQLFLVGDGRGFVVLKKNLNQYTGESSLFVWVGSYFDADKHGPDFTVDEKNALTAQLCEMAKSAGATSVMFESPRRGWDKIALEMGWKPVMTTWKVDVMSC